MTVEIIGSCTECWPNQTWKPLKNLTGFLAVKYGGRFVEATLKKQQIIQHSYHFATAKRNVFPEEFHWVSLIQSPEIPSDRLFDFWPTWLSPMFLSYFVHHLYQAKMTQKKLL